MASVIIGLSSYSGDRLGHLVRGVQMLRSYGSEAHVEHYFDVVSDSKSGDLTPALCTVIACSTNSDVEGLIALSRETEWALGDKPEVLTVTLLQYEDQALTDGHETHWALVWARQVENVVRFLPSREFAQLCDWGQVSLSGEGGVIGEWPSATGR
jgi:hypothetical protein